MTATQSMEGAGRVQDRLHRGRNVTLAFTMQVSTLWFEFGCSSTACSSHYHTSPECWLGGLRCRNGCNSSYNCSQGCSSLYSAHAVGRGIRTPFHLLLHVIVVRPAVS